MRCVIRFFILYMIFIYIHKPILYYRSYYSTLSYLTRILLKRFSITFTSDKFQKPLNFRVFNIVHDCSISNKILHTIDLLMFVYLYSNNSNLNICLSHQFFLNLNRPMWIIIVPIKMLKFSRMAKFR